MSSDRTPEAAPDATGSGPPGPGGLHAGPPREILLYQVLERAVTAATRDEAAVRDARALWDREAGLVHDDEPLYEERAAAFLEWFTLDHRPGPGYWYGSGPHRISDEGPGPRPAPPPAPLPAPLPPPLIDELVAAAAPGSLERAALVALASSHRSVFRIREVHAESLVLDDLWAGAALEVSERRRLLGLTPGEIVDARVVADPERPPELLFTRTFCFHPRGTEAAIRGHVEALRRAPQGRSALLFKLLRLRVRCERFRHLQPARVYAADESLLGER